MTMDAPLLAVSCEFPGCSKSYWWHAGRSFSAIVVHVQYHQRMKKFSCSSCRFFSRYKVYVQAHIQSSCPTAAIIDISHDYLVDYCSTAKSCFPALHQRFVKQVTSQANRAKPQKLDPEIYKRLLEPTGPSQTAIPVNSSSSTSNVQKSINTGQNLADVTNQSLATSMKKSSAVPKATASCTKLQVPSQPTVVIQPSGDALEQAFCLSGSVISSDPVTQLGYVNQLVSNHGGNRYRSKVGNRYRSQAAEILQKIDIYERRKCEETAATQSRLYWQIGHNHDTIKMLGQELHNLQFIEVIDLTED